MLFRSYSCDKSNNGVVDTSKPDLSDLNRYYVRLDNGDKLPIEKFTILRVISSEFLPQYVLNISNNNLDNGYLYYSTLTMVSADTTMLKECDYVYGQYLNWVEIVSGSFMYHPQDNSDYTSNEWQPIRDYYTIESGVLTARKKGDFMTLHFLGTSINDNSIEIYVEITEAMFYKHPN